MIYMIHALHAPVWRSAMVNRSARGALRESAKRRSIVKRVGEYCWGRGCVRGALLGSAVGNNAGGCADGKRDGSWV
jgi:hypothetical protein